MAKADKYNFTACATILTGKPHPEDVAAALIKAKTSFAEAARILRISRNQIQNMVNRFPDIYDLVIEVRESLLDDVEQNVYKKALEGDLGASKFLLTTQGRRRGYGNKLEIENDAQLAVVAMLKQAESGHVLPEAIDVTEVSNGHDNLDAGESEGSDDEP